MKRSNSNMTSHHTFGFWHHITWGEDNIGYDQHGTKWTNKQNPKCSKDEVIMSHANTYIEILKIRRK